jgi:hypothetical protein
MELGNGQFIWAWYEMLNESSKYCEEVFTDIFGKKYATTITRGQVQPKVWAKQCIKVVSLSAPFAELLEKTQDPFVSAIREPLSTKCCIS